MTPLTPMELREMPLSSLKPAHYNPRQVLALSSPAYRKLRASLSEFGLVEPLIWNELTGHIVGGHARIQILKELGIERVMVSVVRLGEAREKALNVVLNNHEAQGRFDSLRLAELLAELQGTHEMELTGFDSRTLANLRYAPEELPPDQSASDEANQVEVTLVTNAATYAELAPRLDLLVREFDLTTHIRRS